MNSGLGKITIVLIILTSFISCGVGKKPVRKNVRMDKYKISKRYGPNIVDTGGEAGTYTESTDNNPNASENKPIIPNEKKKDLIANLQPLWNKELNYTSFSGKAKMHYQGKGQKQEFTAHIRISKNKIIWVSVTALGGVVNVARIYVTPDSIFLVNYLEKEAYKMPIADANKLLPAPVDFSILQNMIIGSVLKRTGTPTDATDFGGTLTLQVEDDKITEQAAFNKLDSTLRTVQILGKNNNGPTGMIQYGGYANIEGRNFSTGRVINISNAGEPYYMDMNFSNVFFDETLDFPFSIPKTYTLK